MKKGNAPLKNRNYGAFAVSDFLSLILQYKKVDGMKGCMLF